MEAIYSKRIVVYLDIITWIGISHGAVHHYGKLTFRNIAGDQAGCDGAEVLAFTSYNELKRVLDRKSAAELNKLDGFISYKPGGLTYRFNTREDVIAKAKVECGVLFPNALLLEQDISSCQPCRVLLAPADFTTQAERMNQLWLEFDGLGQWDKRENEPRCNSIADEFEALLKSFTA